MFLKDLHKQDKLKVVVDDTKQLMKLCVDKEETAPMSIDDSFFDYTFNIANRDIFVLCLDGKSVRVEVVGVENEVVYIEVTKGTIDYDETIAKGIIEKILYDYYKVQDKLVVELITFFKQNDIIFKHPCIIENTDDTLAGGIKIQGIVKGRAIEDKEEGNNSWDIAELSDEDIIRLYRWYDLYQFNESLNKED